VTSGHDRGGEAEAAEHLRESARVELRRRDLLKTAGAGAAALGLGGCGLVDALSAGTDKRERPRNIVLIVIDTLRPDHVGVYGGSARTPSLDALAHESLRFTRVYPEAMATVPARRSIVTAKRVYPFDAWQPWYGMAKRPGWQPMPPGTENISTMMRRRGYWTGYVSDNPFLSHSAPFEPFRRTWDRYVAVLGQRGERRDAHTVPRSEAVRRLPPIMREEHLIWRVRQFLADNGRGVHEAEHAAARVFRWGEKVMRQAGRRKPFLLVVDSFSPHELWAPPRKYLDMYTDSELPGIADVRYRNSDYLTKAQIRLVKATYAASLTMVDTWLGHFMRELKKQGREKDTVVGLVSDHGIFLGEHELTGKSDSYLFEELIHVPLMLRSPDGRAAGQKSDYFATTVDVGPTLMTMAGHEPPDGLDGTDLSPLLDGDQPAAKRPFAYGGYANFSFVREDRWKLIARNDTSWNMLFDIAADPHEWRELSGRHPQVVRRLWKQLLEKTESRPPRYSKSFMESTPREPPKSWYRRG
jgi:arylsulfatase A-like enzyme